MSKKRKITNEVEKVTFRLWPPYSRWIVERAKAANVQPNQFARMALMAIVDSGMLGLTDRMERLEQVLIDFRRDFNNVVDDDLK